MVKKESVTINVPTGMAKYLVTLNPEAELIVVPIYLESNNFAWARSGNSWYKKIRVDRFI